MFIYLSTDDNCLNLEDGDLYQIVMVIGRWPLKDDLSTTVHNTHTWNGVKRYAYDNEVLQVLSKSANGSNATDI